MSTTDEQRLREALTELLAHCGEQGWWMKSHAIAVMDKAQAAVSEPAAPVNARDALTANRDAWMAQAQALAQAAGQASFCLRTLVPDDPDARMTVRMLDAALTRQAAAPAIAEAVLARTVGRDLVNTRCLRDADEMP